MNLRKHSHSHSAEKPYTCTVCNKFFHQKSVFGSNKLVHTGKKVGKLSSEGNSNLNMHCVCARESSLCATCVSSHSHGKHSLLHVCDNMPSIMKKPSLPQNAYHLVITCTWFQSVISILAAQILSTGLHSLLPVVS